MTPLVNTLKRRMAETFLAVYAENYAIDRARLEFYCAQRAFEELVLRAEGHTPQMGQVGGWDFDTLVSTVYKQTGIELQPGSSRSMK